MFRPWLFAVCAVIALSLTRARAQLPVSLDLTRYQRVEIAPSKTSIYIGSVTMTTADFTRSAGTYTATYSAKVFPYFFSSENGTLAIDVSDDALLQLARGEPITFTGLGHNTSGDKRHLEGRAVPTDATTGQIKVRVFISKRIQLVFNTTYRFKP